MLRRIDRQRLKLDGQAALCASQQVVDSSVGEFGSGGYQHVATKHIAVNKTEFVAALEFAEDSRPDMVDDHDACMREH